MKEKQLLVIYVTITGQNCDAKAIPRCQCEVVYALHNQLM